MDKFKNDTKQPKQGVKRLKKVRIHRRKPLPTIPEKLIQEYRGKPMTFKLSSLNPFITCPVCQGYLVDATTVTECLHSFCRSCIVKHFEKSFKCPLCNELTHKTNPWYNLSHGFIDLQCNNVQVLFQLTDSVRSDTVLQDIVGKLVPGFTEGEERRRKVFYKSRGLPIPEKVKKRDPPSDERNTRQADEQPETATSAQSSTMFENDDQITMQLEMKSVETFTEDDILPLKRKFVRCSSQVTIGLLQKFIARKLKLEAANQIEILCSDMELGTDFTLHFIKETIANAQDQSKPLLLHYGLTQV